MQYTGVSLAPTTFAREASTEAAPDTSPAAAEGPPSGDFPSIVESQRALVPYYTQKPASKNAVESSAGIPASVLLLTATQSLLEKYMWACLTWSKQHDGQAAGQGNEA